MVTTHGEQSIMYRLIESLCCTPETNKTLCVNYTSIENSTELITIVLVLLFYLFLSQELFNLDYFVLFSLTNFCIFPFYSYLIR